MPRPTNLDDVQPPEIRVALQTLRDALVAAAGANLAGLILHGGLARGRYRPGESDVNVALVLESTAAADLRLLAPALREAFRTARVVPLLLARGELGAAADVFATKFRELKSARVLLHGIDPFGELELRPEHLRLRVEQELRNLSLRLRRRVIASHDDPAGASRELSELRAPLRATLDVLCELAGQPAPVDADDVALLSHAAATLDLDRSVIERLTARGPDTDSTALLGDVLRVVEQAADRADKIGSVR